MKVHWGQKYKIREEKDSPYYETVLIDQVSNKGVVTVTVYSGTGWWSHRLDISPDKVAKLDWELISDK